MQVIEWTESIVCILAHPLSPTCIQTRHSHTLGTSLDPRHAGEVEVADLHGRQLHLPVLVRDGIGGGRERLYLTERTQGAFVPPKIDEGG